MEKIKAQIKIQVLLAAINDTITTHKTTMLTTTVNQVTRGGGKTRKPRQTHATQKACQKLLHSTCLQRCRWQY